jgi:rhodanese-related sulfurtransferase
MTVKRSSLIAAVGVSLAFSSMAWSYDEEMAASYAKLFAPAAGMQVGKALHFVKPEAFVGDVLAGKEFVAIDVRTPAEAGLYGLTLPNSLAIPVNRVFEPESLAHIPTDKPVVIVCKSGARATVVGTALRHTGFDNVHILKGGLQALAAYCGPKEANPQPDAAR